MVFISSACGDSVLAELQVSQEQSGSSAIPRSAKGKGRAQESADGGAWTIAVEDDGHGSVDVKERWLNIAPVKDFAVVEGDDGRVVSVTG